MLSIIKDQVYVLFVFEGVSELDNMRMLELFVDFNLAVDNTD